MCLFTGRSLALLVLFGVFLPVSPLNGQDQATTEPATETPAPPQRPDSASITFDVTDVPGAWEALRETRLRQSIEALFALPFVANDDNIVALNASMDAIAQRAGIEPTMDSLVGENTSTLRLVIFEPEDSEDTTPTPYILEATMTSAGLAEAVGEVLEANLGPSGVLVRAMAETVTVTNAPDRLMQDRMADWRAPIIEKAFEQVDLEGAQLRFHAQPARDKRPGGGDKISAGHLRFAPDRIDLSMHSLPAREDGVLRVPTGDAATSLDHYVALAETPHVLSLAFHGAATMLDNASRDGVRTRGRMVAFGLERSTGVPVADILDAFGENANLSINTVAIRSMFDFSLGVTGAWEVRDSAKAAAIVDSMKETHHANLRRDAESYGRSTDGLRFRQEEHRGIEVWSAPLMIFPIQPSAPPTLNIALTDDLLLMATSRDALLSLIDRHLDRAGESLLLRQARAGQDFPEQVHSLGTADFTALAEVLRRALPVIVALTQGGSESQTFGRAFTDVIGSLGKGASTGIYEPDGQAVRIAVLLVPPNPAP